MAPAKDKGSLPLRVMARDVAAALYARAIWRTGDMTTATDELERKIVQRVYAEGIPAAAAAAWLKISTRWLRKLSNRAPRKPATLEPHERHVIQLLRDRPARWLTATALAAALEERGVATCEAQVLDVLERLGKVGQVVEERVGRARRFRAAEAVRVFEASDVQQRKKAVVTRAEAIPEIIEQYLGGVPGSAFSVYRYGVPAGREGAIADEVRGAVSEILRRHTAEAEAERGGECGHVTYMLLGGAGWIGAPPVEEDI